MEDTGFPKYQWSKMIGRDRGEQFVFRSNSWEEFTQEVKKIKDHFELKESEVNSSNDVKAAYDARQQSLYPKCDKCGGEKVLNPSTGKIFCKNKCWLNK